MKKEYIYVDLKGKSIEELTELFYILKINKEEIYRDNLNSFVNYPKEYRLLHFDKTWVGYDDNKVEGKTEITIQQLKEILQPMESKEPKSNELKALLEIYYSCRDKHTVINKDEIFKKHGCLNSEYMSVCLKNFNLIDLKGRRSKWIASKPNKDMADDFLIFVKDYVKTKNEKQYLEIKNNNLTLTEQLEKAEAEVKRLKEAIEESNKPKIGDWVFVKESKAIFKVKEIDLEYMNIRHKKITDQELIDKLNELIK